MKIQFITSEEGDWIAMYIDGRLVEQGHSLDEREVAKHISKRIPGSTVGTVEKSYEWFDEQGGHCPPDYPAEG